MARQGVGLRSSKLKLIPESSYNISICMYLHVFPCKDRCRMVLIKPKTGKLLYTADHISPNVMKYFQTVCKWTQTCPRSSGPARRCRGRGGRRFQQFRYSLRRLLRGADFGKIRQNVARFRLYRHRFLQVNTGTNLILNTRFGSFFMSTTLSSIILIVMSL